MNLLNCGSGSGSESLLLDVYVFDVKPKAGVLALVEFWDNARFQ